jgi:hypothetical protein
LAQNKNLWIIKLQDEKIVANLINGLKELPWNFVVITQNDYKNEENIVFLKKDISIDCWFDFIICDDEANCKLNLSFKKWIIPIIHKDNHLSTLLREFNPMANEWNSFMYAKNNEWSIFYAISRCLENLKYPQDKKNLVKNVYEI